METVEVVYLPIGAPPFRAVMTWQQGMTVEDVITQSGVLALHPEATDLPVGIFATKVALSAVVHARDRVEIYRRLLRDPKDRRRQKARGQ